MGTVNGAPLERPESDVAVGFLEDGPMRCRVSVRGGRNIVLLFARGGRAWEVALSPRAARQLLEIVEAAAQAGGGAWVRC